MVSIQTLIGTEVRSRNNADKVRLALEVNNGSDTPRIIDFSGVSFVSRSFADELCNIMDENKDVKLANETDFVKRMIDTVLSGRKRVRQRPINEDRIVNCSTMEELKQVLERL